MLSNRTSLLYCLRYPNALRRKRRKRRKRRCARNRKLTSCFRSYWVKMVMNVKESSSCRTSSSCFMVAVTLLKESRTA